MAKTQDTVLLVDDDVSVRLLVRGALERRGIQVMEASDGARALAVLGERMPDAVLLDAMMPGLDGFETCRRIRAMRGGERVPVLMLTSLDDADSVAHAYESGATDFFVKSAQQALLAERVRYMLRSSRTQADLIESREKLAKAQRIARMGNWEWDLRAATVHCSRECLRVLEIEAGEGDVAQDAFAARFGVASAEVLAHEILSALGEEPDFHREYALPGEGGAVRHLRIECEIDAVENAEIASIHGTIQDVTERRNAEEQVRQLANFDTLTGLPNRSLFRERFDRVLAEAARTHTQIAVLFVDLDRFKMVNDTLGHVAGDALLREVSARLSRCAGAGEAAGDERGSVARLGGDEFAVLLKCPEGRQNAIEAAERMLEALREPLDLLGHEFWISASIGIAVYPDDGEDSETLLMRADAAMYHVKGRGRDGHALYSPVLGSRNLERFRLEADLRKAIARDELRPHFQPIVDVLTGKIVGAEVLMRWQRGDVLVPPGEFIPVAEDAGLIIAMGEWALDTACRHVKRWHDRGLDRIYVTVNVTASHFQQRDLHSCVRKALDAAKLGSDSLQIEITETVAMQAVDHTLRTLRALRELGVRFAIDDFGTGYSSLAYLKRLPIDALKVDRSFVKDIAVDPEDEVIVSAIIGLARSLNLAVVAEGVETEAQMAFIHMFGGSLMQGFLFSRPLPAESFEALLVETSGASFKQQWIAPDRNRVIHLFENGARPLGPARRADAAAG
jgi:diguanylate cyclase (GGDEF)-like protein